MKVWYIIYKKKIWGKNATLGVCIRYTCFYYMRLLNEEKEKRKKYKRIGARIFIIFII